MLKSHDPLTQLVRDHSLNHWNDLVGFVRRLPYGRNANRSDFSLVMKELKGTCSSKHAFLKKIADLNHIDNVKLVIGLYKMNNVNTPKIETTIAEVGLPYIPEAHCYLVINKERIDITSEQSDFEKLALDILDEMEIEPEQVDTFKVEFHKNYLKKWIAENAIPHKFDEVWKVRERCIEKLGG